ncbi:unnamed protein product [Ixodes pacificus]
MEYMPVCGCPFLNIFPLLLFPRVALSTAQALRSYAISLARNCPGLSPVGKIHQDLLYSRSPLSLRKIRYNLTCTGIGSTPCQITNDLTTWNEFLWLIHAELKELSPGKLGVVHVLGCRSKAVTDLQRQHACILLHWLLNEHHCVETLELDSSVIPMNHHLFCYALRVSSGLKRLKLSRYDLSASVSEDIMAAVATMVALEDLEFAWVSVSVGALRRLGIFLEQSQSLKRLVLHLPRTTTRGVAANLAGGLAASRSLVSLTMNDGCLRDQNGDVVFAQYLAQNATLKELVIEVQIYDGTGSIAVLLSSLKTNQCLETLKLFSGHWDPSDGDILTDAMTVNDTLRSLRVGDDSMSDTTFLAELIERNVGLVELEIVTCSTWHLEAIGQAIRKNTRLRRLTLRCNATSVDDARPLLEVIADSKTLELVFLKNIHESRIGEFRMVLKEMGIEDKVRYRSYISEPLIYVSTINAGQRMRRDYYGPQDSLDLGIVRDGLCQLACLPDIVQLTLKLDQYLDVECATLLANFMSSNWALKDVHLSFFTKDATTLILVQGLKANRSINNLIIEDWNFSEGNTGAFGAFLKKSKTLNHLTVLSSGAWILTREMVRCLTDNYFLTEFRTMELRELENSMYQVREILRRNVAMLFQAVQFVRGVRTRKCALAFELLCESESLFRLMKDHALGSDPDLKQWIREGKRYLELNFMTLAGVVSESVVCEDVNGGQRLQLDRIGLENWLKVRSYLKIRDVVKKSPTGPRRTVHT